MTKSPTFTPWKKQMATGVFFVFVGLGAAYLFAATHPYLAIGGLATVGVGTAFIKKASAREHGQKIEQESIKSLKKALSSSWHIENNIALRTGGDLDLLLTRDDNARFAIEIKSHEGVLLKRSLFGTSESLVRANGKTFDRDPVIQVINAATELDATPVIWLPMATNAKTFKMRCGVTVVQGSQRQLRHAIGASNWWSI